MMGAVRTAAVVLVLSATAGCSIPRLIAPVGVEPLPYDWKIVTLSSSIDEASAASSFELCKMKKRWVLANFQSTGECHKTSGLGKQDRNELQHMLMGSATQACHKFKRKLYSMTKGGMLFGAASQLSSAASGLLRIERSARIAASAGTVTGAVGGEFDGYFRESKMAIALAGIELARTRIFKQVKDQKDKA